MTSSSVESEFATVKDDLARLRADVAALSSAMRDATSGTVQEQIDVIRDRINRLAGEAKEEGRQRLDDLAGRVEERPLTSVLLAFGVGMLIGRLLDR
jgi:ElaB/YqjD/DUF883 family membrane-anchored ribosome-binding protein